MLVVTQLDEAEFINSKLLGFVINYELKTKLSRLSTLTKFY